MGNPPDPQGVPLNWSFGIQPGPDGKAWVCHYIDTPLARQSFMMPADTAIEMADSVARAMKDTGNTCKAQNGETLSVASVNTISSLLKGKNNG